MNVQLTDRPPFMDFDNIAEKKRLIFESTLELVKEYGFHGTTMNTLAKTANIAAGTIYHYFESKDLLIMELSLYVKRQMAMAIVDKLDKDTGYQDNFFRIWKNLFYYYCDNQTILLFWEQYLNSPYCKCKVSEVDDLFYKVYFGFFQEAQLGKAICDINYEVLAILVHAQIRMTAKIQLFGKTIIDETELEKIITLSWNGLKNNAVA